MQSDFQYFAWTAGIKKTNDRTYAMNVKATSSLGLLEKIFLAGLTTGLVLTYFNASSQIIVQVSIVGLGITYFLTAFRFIDIPRNEEDLLEFRDVLAWTIAPKVIWISCGVSLFGLFIFSLQLGHDGHKRALMIGSLGAVIGLIVIGYAYATGTKHLKHILPTVFRAVPLLIIDLYFLYR